MPPTTSSVLSLFACLTLACALPLTTLGSGAECAEHVVPGVFPAARALDAACDEVPSPTLAR